MIPGYCTDTDTDLSTPGDQGQELVNCCKDLLLVLEASMLCPAPRTLTWGTVLHHPVVVAVVVVVVEDNLETENMLEMQCYTGDDRVVVKILCCWLIMFASPQQFKKCATMMMMRRVLTAAVLLWSWQLMTASTPSCSSCQDTIFPPRLLISDTGVWAVLSSLTGSSSCTIIDCKIFADFSTKFHVRYSTLKDSKVDYNIWRSREHFWLTVLTVTRVDNL